MSAPGTPRARVAEPATPIPARIGSTVQSSPHYTTTRRHSLYGTEDRIILDPGSRIWKVGFSGEGRPRDVMLVADSQHGETSLWKLTRLEGDVGMEEQERMLEAMLQDRLRAVFHDSLLTDPKSRKVIIVENALLPLYIKEMIARILFNNLQVPSISFASSHLLALLGVGRITGLVLDCGYLESTALPLFASRPLFPNLRTTPLAGARLTNHLRALLLYFGEYYPPLTSLGGSANTPAASHPKRVPAEILTDAVMEEIKMRCCFVGPALDDAENLTGSPALEADSSVELEVPPSDMSIEDSEASHSPSHRASMDVDMASVSVPSGSTSLSVDAAPHVRQGEAYLRKLRKMYERNSTATNLAFKVVPPPGSQTGTGRGTLIVPGWIRERGAEVLFDGGDVDESSVAEVILDALLKVPVDLRKTLASSILVVGGTPMLPGFIPRLHAELIQALTRPLPSPSPRTSRARNTSTRNANKPNPPPYDHYASIRPLAPHIAILNNPSPDSSSATGVVRSSRASAHAGKAPAFTPAVLPWVGGSLAGALKIGGEEIAREKWDEATGGQDDEIGPDESMEVVDERPRRAPHILPDWSRAPLLPGAPPAPRPQQLPAMSQQAAVGA
ncbi:actin-like ATPase domain-containing protein [Rickenella mellea]|uniref:Actin-like ATPase domain-containing protein n=1 Tax=Rickenella mellea TaxID=50990 RepID=A0A4Y7QDB9_9AGAM|nr:actin-like ATPase domain-containing protein [Rickenella mellea]